MKRCFKIKIVNMLMAELNFQIKCQQWTVIVICTTCKFGSSILIQNKYNILKPQAIKSICLLF